MQTKEITIQVTPEAAAIYESASEQEKMKLDLLISLELCNRDNSVQSLFEIMDRVSDEAKKNGLTEEILEEILNEE